MSKATKPTTMDLMLEQARDGQAALKLLSLRLERALIDGDAATVKRIWQAAIRTERKEQEAQT